MAYLTHKLEDSILENFFESCYQASKSVPEVLTRFCESLKSDSNIPEDISVLLENAISKYRDIITNPVYLSDFRTVFNEVHDLLSTTPNISSFKMEGRCKSAVNTVEKLVKLLKEGRSLDLFRDALGIRFVLFGKKEDEEETQKELYNICLIIIKFLLEKNFTLCESADSRLKQEELDNGVQIVVPEKSLIPPTYRSCVKDYVFFHKKNGYQSIHMVFRAPNGSCIEIQLRTEEMHLHAEYFEADHKAYKLTEYTDSRNQSRLKDKLDFSKVNLPGFRYIGTLEKPYSDYIGLLDSLRIYFRTYIPWHPPN